MNREEAGPFMPMKRRIYWIFTIVLVLAAVELSCRAAIFLLGKTRGITYDPLPDYYLSAEQKEQIVELLDGKFQYIDYDPDLGWALKRSGAAAGYHANGRGIRAAREYSFEPPDGVVRIAAFGDSFTHGDEVGDARTWEAQMESLDPRLEVLNFGVGGYGMDQAYLRYLKTGVRFNPRIVLIGFTMSMINRCGNVFNPFVRRESIFPLAKPRFILKNKSLRRLPNPFGTVGAYRQLLNDDYDFSSIMKTDVTYPRLYFRSPWDVLGAVRLVKMVRRMAAESRIVKGVKILDSAFNPNTEVFKISMMVCEKFYRDVMSHGSLPIVVIFPDGLDIMTKRKHNREQSEPIMAYCKEHGMDYINLMGAFDGVDTAALKDYFAPGKHYSTKGNRLCAEYILKYLETRNLVKVN